MRMRLCVVLTVMLMAAEPVAAQPSALDKFEWDQIPAEERMGLPPEVVAVLGSHRGWHQTKGKVSSMIATAQGKLISSAGEALHLWDINSMYVRSLVKGTPKEDLRVVTVSPDGQKLVVVKTWVSKSKDDERAQIALELWEVQDGTPQVAAILADTGLDNSTASKVMAAFQDKSNKLVVLWPDSPLDAGGLRIWNFTAKQWLEEPRLQLKALPLPEHSEPHAACLSDRGKSVVLLVGESWLNKNSKTPKSVKPQLVVVDLEKKKQVKSVEMPTEVSEAVLQISEDSRLLTIVGSDRRLLVYDLAASPAKLVCSGFGVENSTASVAVDPKGRWLAYVGTDAKAGPELIGSNQAAHAIRLLELAPGGPIEHIVAANVRWRDVEALTFTPDGKTLLAAMSSGPIQVWDLKDGKATERWQGTGHRSWVWATAFTADGKSLLTAGRDRQLCLWDLSQGKPILAASVKDRSTVFALAAAPGGSLWASAGMDPAGASLWKLQAGKLTLAQQLPLQPKDLWSVTFSKDGEWLYTATGVESINALDKQTENTDGIGVWRVKEDTAVLQTTLGEHKGGVFSLALSPDGKLLVSAGGRIVHNEKGQPEGFGEIFVWDVTGAEPRKIGSLEGHAGIVYRVQFSADGKMLASTGRDKEIGLWSVHGTEIKLRKGLEGHADPVLALAFAPDGKTLLTSDVAGKLLLWDVKTGNVLQSWQFHDRICSLAFAPDGRHFATGNGWGTAYIFRVPAGKQ